MTIDIDSLGQVVYINGEWISPKGPTFDSLEPETGEILATLPVCGPEVVDQAVVAASEALEAWVSLGARRRCELLTALAERLLEEYGEEGADTPLKTLISRETGKRRPEADIEVVESSDMVRYFAETAPTVLADEEPALDSQLWPTKRTVVRMTPHGVVGIIKAWNYPLEIPLWSIAPALAAGNTVVFKPSELSPLVGLALGRLVHEVGFPPGVFNVVTGARSTGEHIVAHSGVSLVSFTGGVDSGRSIAGAAAQRLVPCKLELGGNDPAIVLPDADLDLTSKGIVWGSICNSGQVCVGIKRVFVVEGVYEELIHMLNNGVSTLRAGTDFGPIISERHLAQIEDLVGDAIRQGAELLYGGVRIREAGPLYYSPTLLVNVPRTSRIASEECFGPIIAIYRVETVEDAVSAANDSEYGLGASIWTSSTNQFEAIANRLECGMVWENDVNIAVPQGPWGGMKSSGFGTELSRVGIREYAVPRHLQFEMGSEADRAWWYPYK